MNKDWSLQCKTFQEDISKKVSFDTGKNLLLNLRKDLYDFVIHFKKVTPNSICYYQPLIKSKGYDSKTIIYSLFHIARIEDIVCNTIIKNEEQIFFKYNFYKSTKTPLITTGNELKGVEIAEFSQKLDVDEVYKYFEKVYQTSNKYINDLAFEDLKISVDITARERVINSKCVSNDENAVWLIDYWCNKNVLGLLKMPFSRHWIMHIEAMVRIKNAIEKKL